MKTLKTYSILWFVAAIFSLGILLLMVSHPSFRVERLLQIQFSDSLEAFNSLVSNYPKELSVRNIYLDFVFILGFTALNILSFKILAKTLGFKLNKLLILLALLPGFFDAIEDVCHLIVLNNPNNELIFNVFYTSVYLKWFFAIPTSLILLSIVFYYLGVVFSFFLGRSDDSSKPPHQNSTLLLALCHWGDFGFGIQLLQ